MRLRIMNQEIRDLLADCRKQAEELNNQSSPGLAFRVKNDPHLRNYKEYMDKFNFSLKKKPIIPEKIIRESEKFIALTKDIPTIERHALQFSENIEKLIRACNQYIIKTNQQAAVKNHLLASERIRQDIEKEMDIHQQIALLARIKEHQLKRDSDYVEYNLESSEDVDTISNINENYATALNRLEEKIKESQKKLIKKESSAVREKLSNKINSDYNKKNDILKNNIESTKTIIHTYTEPENNIYQKLIASSNKVTSVDFKKKLEDIRLSIEEKNSLGEKEDYDDIRKNIKALKETVPSEAADFLAAYKEILNKQLNELSVLLTATPNSYPIEAEFNNLRSRVTEVIPGLTEDKFDTAIDELGIKLSILRDTKDVLDLLAKNKNTYKEKIKYEILNVKNEIKKVEELIQDYQPVTNLISDMESSVNQRLALINRQKSIDSENKFFSEIMKPYIFNDNIEQEKINRATEINGELFEKIKRQLIDKKTSKLREHAKKPSKGGLIHQYIAHLENAKNLYELIQISQCNPMQGHTANSNFYNSLTEATGTFRKAFSINSTTKNLIGDLHKDLNKIIADEYYYEQSYNEIKIDIYKKSDILLSTKVSAEKSSLTEHPYIVWVSNLKPSNKVVQKLQMELNSIKSSAGTDEIKNIRMQTAIRAVYLHTLDKKSKLYEEFNKFIEKEKIGHIPQAQQTYASLYQELKHNVAVSKTKRSTDPLFAALDAVGGNRNLDDGKKIEEMIKIVLHFYQHTFVKGSSIRYFEGSNLGSVLQDFLTIRGKYTKDDIQNVNAEGNKPIKSQ